MVAQLPTGRRSALIIATAAYDDRQLEQLRSPARDAIRLRQLLADPAVGGFEVTSAIECDEPQIRRTAARFLKDRSTAELIVVYISCHGLLDPRGRLYFAGKDTSKDLLEATALESRWLLDRLDECRARQQVLILDCCFSGAFASGSKGDLNLEARLTRQARGRVVMTASRDAEYSFEGQSLSRPDVTSAFTAGLIDGLASGAADADQDGLISVQDAHDYTSRYVAELGQLQNPQLWMYSGEGSIILARSPVGATVIPARLPDHIRRSLESPSSNVRIGAVYDLGELLKASDLSLALAAYQALRQIASEDNPRVASVSRQHLEAIDHSAS